MITLISLHWAHASITLIVAGLCAWIYRKKLANGLNHHLIFWLLACLVWVAYYVLKALGFLLPTTDALNPRMVFDVAFNITNSILVLGCSISLNSQRVSEHVSFRSTLGSTFFAWLLFCGSLIVLAIVLEAFDPAPSTTPIALAFTASLVAASSLVLLVHRSVILPHLTEDPRSRKGPSVSLGVALGVFGMYAYLQAYYPYFFTQTSKSHPEWIIFTIYLAAGMLKWACSIILFRNAPTLGVLTSIDKTRVRG